MIGELPRIRERWEDFEVEEVPVEEPTGAGEHCWLWVEKRGRNTEEVARELARGAGCAAAQVGFAGRKDRRAVTRQWLSVPGLNPEAAREVKIDGVRVLRAVPSRAKLRLGELRGNRFRLKVRGVDAGLAHAARSAAVEIARFGMPNAFGSQRFGRDGANVERGLELLLPRVATESRERSRHRGGRRRERFWIAAVQAEVFNRFLERRPLPPHRAQPGDLVLDHAAGVVRWIGADGAEGLVPALDAFRISPTGLLFGTKVRRARGVPGALEGEILEELGLSGVEGHPALRRLGLFGDRRPLRVPVEGLSLEHEEGRLRLQVFLPAGSYATVLLEALLPGGFRAAGAEKPLREGDPGPGIG